MKKNSFVQATLLSATFCAIMLFSSCGDDSEETTPAPTADFTVTIDGKTVAFTNTSADAESYSWDFNDGNTSSEESPSHTYESNGTYLVELTATNKTGSETKSSVLEIININIDGDLSDWDDVIAIASIGTGSLTSVKIDNLSKDKLFVYIEGTADMTSFFDLYLDFDFDATGESDTTGYIASVYPKAVKVGCDVLFEGFFGNENARNELSGMFYGVFLADADVDFGARDEPTLDPNMIAFSDMQAVGSGFALEFSIDLSFLPDRITVNDEMQLFIDEWDNKADAPADWWAGGFSGHFPEQDNEESLPIRYEFKGVDN
ncbi:PKD domain-containing protein [Reichenbachiella faecimaris]|nr:PKD domain-containing protein [Reichenbachiella faecimaris]